MRKFLCGVALFSVLCMVASADPTVTKSTTRGEVQSVGNIGAPAVRVISDEAKERGVVASGLGEAPVFYMNDSCASGYNYTSLFMDDSDGNLATHRISFGNGYAAGTTELVAHEMLVFVSSSGFPSNAETSEVTLELWDADPMAAFDTVCMRGTDPAPYAGTLCTFSGLLRGTSNLLRCDIPKTVINCDHMFQVLHVVNGCQVLTQVPCVSDPLNSAEMFQRPADVGDGNAWESVYACEQATACPTANGYNSGTCCENNSLACDHTDGVLECFRARHCGDNVCDFFAYTYDAAPPTYYNFIAGVFANTDVIMQVIPKYVDDPVLPNAADVTIAGNDLTIDQGAPGAIRHMWFEIYAGDWDPTATGLKLKAWQAGIDASGYQAGIECGLTPWRPACLTTADCTTALGPQGVGALAGGCDMPGMPPSVCMAGWANDTRTDFIFQAAHLGGVDQSTLNYRYGATLMGLPIVSPHIGNMYLGSLALTTDCACPKGDFQVKVGLPNVNSNMVDQNSQFIKLLGVVPANIHFPMGQCCNISVSPTVCLADDVTRCECQQLGIDGGFAVNFDTTKTCDDECIECLVVGDCADDDACTVDRCVANFCTHTAVTVPAGSCCNDVPANETADVNGAGTIAAYDDGNQCTADHCTATDCGASPASACGVPVNDVMEGAECYDGEPCITVNDTCQADATCVGTDILTIECDDNEDCEILTQTLGTCNPVTGFCRCVPPSLNFEITGSQKPNEMCFAIGSPVTVDVYYKDVPVIVTGGQFVIEYDPACLAFESIVPGGDPFVTELKEIVNEGAGNIFYAVGVDPFGGEGQISTGVLAKVTFTKIGVCETCNLCFGGENPIDTLLGDSTGQFVDDVVENCSADIMENDIITLDVPADIVTNVNSCNSPTACVYWAPPTADGSCYDVNLVCVGPWPVGNVHYVNPMTGGCLPHGTWNFSCTATSTVCGDSVTDGWTVTVNDEVTLDVTLQVSPVIVADEIDRCIKFELFADCVQDPLVLELPVTLGGLWDHTGHFTEGIKVPADGNWICITARDQLHTLRSCDYLTCDDGVYTAVFKGDPFFGGNWLIGGNLDGWKKSNPNASHDVINILDFGQFVAAYGTNYGSGDTACTTQGPHADINGDGVVDALDFTFVSMNFLASSKECCCGGGGVASAIDTAVSVEWLRANGMAELAVGDLNRDGILDVSDLQAFQAGKRPIEKGSRDRSNAGVR